MHPFFPPSCDFPSWAQPRQALVCDRGAGRRARKSHGFLLAAATRCRRPCFDAAQHSRRPACWRAPLSAWTTSERMHNVLEQGRVVGCGEDQDSLRHYCACHVATAILATYVVAFRARDRTPRSLLGLAPGSDAQRSDAAVGVMTLYTAQFAPVAGLARCMHATSSTSSPPPG